MIYIVATQWAWLVATIGLLLAIATVVLLLALIVSRATVFIRGLIEQPRFAALTEDELVVRTIKKRLERIPYREIAFVSIVDVQPWVRAREYGIAKE